MTSATHRRFYTSSLKDKVLKSIGLRNRGEVVIPEEHLPKLYANAVQQHKEKEGESYGDYANSQVVFNWQDDYEFIEKIGRGRYSEVYKACDLLTNETVVVKMLKPVKKEKVRRELMVLEAVRDSPYIIKLID